MVSGNSQILPPFKKVIKNLWRHIIGRAASDVFTAADIRIQKTIEFNLKQLYPRAKIIGEEDDEDKSYPSEEPYILPE